MGFFKPLSVSGEEKGKAEVSGNAAEKDVLARRHTLRLRNQMRSGLDFRSARRRGCWCTQTCPH